MDERAKHPDAERVVGKALPHDSAHLHVTGRAAYTDDLPEPRDLLHIAVGLSTEAHAKIRSMDLAAVRAHPGVVAVFASDAITGENNYGPVVHDDPILAEGRVRYVGQPVFAVAATSVGAARRAARKARISYEALEAVLDTEAALSRSRPVSRQGGAPTAASRALRWAGPVLS